MNIRDTRRVQDGFNQRGRYKARVVPFAVIANAEIQHVDIFIAVAWVDIEKEEEWLRQHGVHYGQGWLYSKALPKEDFLRWAEQHL